MINIVCLVLFFITMYVGLFVEFEMITLSLGKLKSAMRGASLNEYAYKLYTYVLYTYLVLCVYLLFLLTVIQLY